MSYKILLTGATGYIGNSLCQRLVSEGWDVSALLRKEGGRLPFEQRTSIAEYYYDGSIESIFFAIKKSRPQVVIHLASFSVLEHKCEDVNKLVNANILFSTQLIEASYRSNVSYFINTGTFWQHYRKHEYDPVCLYAATKQAFEDILDFYADACPLKIITLTLYDTYGPRDKRSKIFNLIKNSVIEGCELELSPGEQRLNLTHIDEVVDAYFVAIDRLIMKKSIVNHEKFSIYSKDTVSIRNLVDLFESVLNKKIKVKFGARDYRYREVMNPIFFGAILPGWIQSLNLRTEILNIVADDREK